MGEDAAEETAGDYSYDLAHEATEVEAAAAREPEPGPDPVEVTTQAADDGGDYSYDLAHDVPAQDE